jgi:hypothetical protein
MRVTLEWDAPAPAEWHTDAGYEVRLQEGWVVTSEVHLVPCAAQSSRLRWPSLSIPEAYAGHTMTPEQERLRLRAPHAQSLLENATLFVGELHPPATGYCAAFYLVSRTPGDIALGGAPAAIDMTGLRLALFLRGEQRRAGAAGFTPFSAQTQSAYGHWLGPAGVLTAIPLDAVLSIRGRSELHVVRSRKHLFDGIDFATATSEMIARQVVAHLVDEASAFAESK